MECGDLTTALCRVREGIETADRKLMEVQVKLESSFQTSAPTPLFQTQVVRYGAPNRYVVTGDGQRFVVNSPVEEVSQTPITVVLNWTASLKKN